MLFVMDCINTNANDSYLVPLGEGFCRRFPWPTSYVHNRTNTLSSKITRILRLGRIADSKVK